MITPAAAVRSRRPLVLAWLALAILPFAAVTATMTRFHRHHLETLAVAWAARGEAALGSGRAADAVNDFRSALLYAREDRALRLQLARALLAGGRTAEARGYLLTLRADEPGDGAVNLELARIAARTGNMADAIRYYHGATEGAWEQDAEQRRREARLELVNALVSQGRIDAARPDLIALSSDLPDERAGKMRIADVLARAGLSGAALTTYQRVLDSSPEDDAALAGAAEAAFHSADYRQAARYFERALARGATSADLARDAEVAELVLALDPWQRRLGAKTRTARAAHAFEIAAARLAACATLHPDTATLQALIAETGALAPRASVRSLARNPDDLDALLDAVSTIEIETAQACGEPTGRDRALYLLAQRRNAER